MSRVVSVVAKSLLFVLVLLVAGTGNGPVRADWRDQQWTDMDTGEMVGTDRSTDPSQQQSAIPFVVNATCSETADRRQLSCYFVRLAFLVEKGACNADVIVYRVTLTLVERSDTRTVWLLTGKPAPVTGEVISHRLQVTFNPATMRPTGQPFSVDRWEYRTEAFYPKNKELNSTALASSPTGPRAWRVPFSAPCRPNAVGIQPFTSRRGAVVPD